MNQGCIHEGKDHRNLGWLVCFLQRIFSWKSDKPPVIHRHGTWGYSLWPPYLVVNKPADVAQVKYPLHDDLVWEVLEWRMFRIGFRYDKNWKGYIFPAAAWKRIDRPLLYY